MSNISFVLLTATEFNSLRDIVIDFAAMLSSYGIALPNHVQRAATMLAKKAPTTYESHVDALNLDNYDAPQADDTNTPSDCGD